MYVCVYTSYEYKSYMLKIIIFNIVLDDSSYLTVTPMTSLSDKAINQYL